MTRWAAFGFAATVSMFLPAAWHATEAELPRDGALIKPPIEKFRVGDAEVKVEVDRAAVAPGGEVRVALSATAEKPQKISLVLREMGGQIEAGERVEAVPQTLSRQDVTIEAAPGGGKPRTVTFHLPASKGRKGKVTQYAILVQPAKAARKIRSAWELALQADPRLDDEDAEEAAPEQPAQAAMVRVVTHEPEAYSLTIEPPASLADGKPFELSVRVKNPGKRELREVHVELSPAPEVFSAMGGLEGGASEDWSITPVDPNAVDIETLAAGAERVIKYRVEPGKRMARFGLMASSWSENAGNALDFKTLSSHEQVAAK